MSFFDKYFFGYLPKKTKDIVRLICLLVLLFLIFEIAITFIFIVFIIGILSRILMYFFK